MLKINFRGISKKTFYVRVVIIFMFIFFGVLGYVLFINKENKINTENNNTYASTEEYFKTKTDTIEGKRSYLSKLMSKEDVSEGVKYASEIYSESRLLEDANKLVQICALHRVDDFANCSSIVRDQIISDVSRQDFNNAFALAEIYEKFGDNQIAALLYSEAVNQYPKNEDLGDMDLPTKEELNIKAEKFRNDR